MIIDGILSLGITLPQIILLPEVPSRLVANFMFSEAEVQLAKDRHPKEGRAEKVAFTRAQVNISHARDGYFANTECRSRSGSPHQRSGFYGSSQCMYILDSSDSLCSSLHTQMQHDRNATLAIPEFLVQRLEQHQKRIIHCSPNQCVLKISFLPKPRTLIRTTADNYTTPMYATILVTTVGMAWISESQDDDYGRTTND